MLLEKKHAPQKKMGEEDCTRKTTFGREWKIFDIGERDKALQAFHARRSETGTVLNVGK